MRIHIFALLNGRRTRPCLLGQPGAALSDGGSGTIFNWAIVSAFTKPDSLFHLETSLLFSVIAFYSLFSWSYLTLFTPLCQGRVDSSQKAEVGKDK
ncbi:MAG: hypothetical protein BGO39_35470 [Chloroflexi bacterium 54-19]|nr:MAG: hypothetical protein BGO39_35470 [Chloroflexi bacterium 54-19]